MDKNYNPMLRYVTEVTLCTIDEAPKYFSDGWLAVLAEYSGDSKKLLMARFSLPNSDMIHK